MIPPGSNLRSRQRRAEGAAGRTGLQYKILKAGDGKKPTATDTVVCHYRGTLINGKEFDSSHRRGQPATLNVGGVIRGWQEALQLMPVGSKWQLFIPPQLAYERSRAHEESDPGGCGLCLRFAVQPCRGGDL